MIFEIERIENIIKYEFKNKKLLEVAFTHKSYANEHRCESNERLEFLGDSILGFIVSEYLFFKYKKQDNEGELTRRKQQLVSTKPLACVIKNLQLESALLLGEGIDLKGEKADRFFENTFESLVGAIYLDGGINAATNFIKNNLLVNERSLKTSCLTEDYKSNLQVYTQANKLGTPKYELIAKLGPDHAPQFTIARVIGGKKVAVGTGTSKADASKDAARRALKKITRQDI